MLTQDTVVICIGAWSCDIVMGVAFVSLQASFINLLITACLLVYLFVYLLLIVCVLVMTESTIFDLQLFTESLLCSGQEHNIQLASQLLTLSPSSLHLPPSHTYAPQSQVSSTCMQGNPPLCALVRCEASQIAKRSKYHVLKYNV